MMLEGANYMNVKHHPHPILAKRQGIQFVKDSKNIKSSDIITSVLAIMNLRGKYWQSITQDINVNHAKNPCEFCRGNILLPYISPVILLSSNHVAKYRPTKVFLVNSNAISRREIDQQGHHLRLRRNLET